MKRYYVLALLYFVLHMAISKAEDVTHLVQIQTGGYLFNRVANTFDSRVTITNNGSVTLAAPILLELSGLDPRISLTNANGFTAQGNPYFAILHSGGLSAGNSVTGTLRFSNPFRLRIAYTATVASENLGLAPRAIIRPLPDVALWRPVVIDASLSEARSGARLLYRWRVVSKPAGSLVLASPDPSLNSTATFVADLPGSYWLGLIVSDGAAQSAEAFIEIKTDSAKGIIGVSGGTIALRDATAMQIAPGTFSKQTDVTITSAVFPTDGFRLPSWANPRAALYVAHNGEAAKPLFVQFPIAPNASAHYVVSRVESDLPSRSLSIVGTADKENMALVTELVHSNGIRESGLYAVVELAQDVRLMNVRAVAPSRVPVAHATLLSPSAPGFVARSSSLGFALLPIVPSDGQAAVWATHAGNARVSAGLSMVPVGIDPPWPVELPTLLDKWVDVVLDKLDLDLDDVPEAPAQPCNAPIVQVTPQQIPDAFGLPFFTGQSRQLHVNCDGQDCTSSPGPADLLMMPVVGWELVAVSYVANPLGYSPPPPSPSPISVTPGGLVGAKYEGQGNVAVLATKHCLRRQGLALFWQSAPSAPALVNPIDVTYRPLLLEIVPIGSGAGAVVSQPGRISCFPTCDDSFAPDTVVTLQATANAPDWYFVEWSGDCAGKATTTTVLMNANKLCRARFEQHPELRVNLLGSGLGGVASVPAGISCDPDCYEQYQAGTLVTLTAGAAAGSHFVGWSGDCTGTASSISLTMRESQAVRCDARFELLPRLSVSIGGTGKGNVSSSPSGIACPGQCLADFSPNSLVQLMASPAQGSTFVKWSAECQSCGAEASCAIPMTQARACSAEFACGGGGSLGALTFSASRSATGVANIPECADKVSVKVTVPSNMISGSGTTGHCGPFGDRRVTIHVCRPNHGCQSVNIAGGYGQGLDLCHDFTQVLGPFQFLNGFVANSTVTVVADIERTATVEVTFP
jgi:hypothetical protein